MIVTFFKTIAARKKTEEDLSLQELADRVTTARARTKTQLPWLKLAEFGEATTAQGSLRHDANVVAVTGFEGDYDGEVVTMDEAAQLLSGVSCMLYTSPSHRPDKPRWRVVGFFSESLPPSERLVQVHKINTILGGVLADESFKLSQAYYYGRVDGSPDVETKIVHGDPIDTIDNLEADNPFTRASVVGIIDVDDRLAQMRHRGEGDTGVHATQLAVTASLLNAGVGMDDVVDRVLEATRAVGPRAWDWDREERTIRGMCRTWLNRLDLEHQQATAQVIDLGSARAALRHERWERSLILKKNKTVDPVHHNLVLFLVNHGSWEGVLGYDEFKRMVVLLKPPPWVDQREAWRVRPWIDDDDLRTLFWFQSAKVMAPSASMVNGAAIDAAKQNIFHPVRDYLSTLRWDGVERLDRWTIDYLGSVDNSYVRAVSSHSMVAAVARIMRPGVKVDTILILEGPQGTLKSSALRILFGEWFTDEIADFGSKDAAMQMLGKWCVEVSELDAMSRAEVSKIKAFVSRQEDRFRPPYGRSVIETPRQCVLFGSCNVDTYLRDETGGRRFWPIRTSRIDLSGLDQVRDQIWAEAKSRYESGAPWWITNNETLRIAHEEQEGRYVSDSWEGVIAAYLDSDDRQETSVHEILIFLGIVEDRQDQSKQQRVARILKRLGWDRVRVTENGRRMWKYRSGR